MATRQLRPRATTWRSPVQLPLVRRLHIIHSTLTLTRKSEIAKAKDLAVRLHDESELSNLVPAVSSLNGDDRSTEPDPFTGAFRFSPEPNDDVPGYGKENEEAQLEENESDCEGTRGVLSGPLSKEARLEAQRLGDVVVKESERIAQKFNKSRREIIMAAGLGFRSARTANSFNMFKKWYSYHNARRTDECESLSILALHRRLRNCSFGGVQQTYGGSLSPGHQVHQ
jgi:hypothetical protein